MLTIEDGLDALLLGCFFFGLLFSVALVFVGGADIGPDSGGEADGEGAIPINLGTLLAFAAWFGGVGYLARNAAGWALPFVLIAGVTGGLVGAAAVAWVVSRFVTSREGELDPADFRLPGTIGRVTSSIRANGTGEVVYEQRGVRQVTGARAGDGAAIPRGAEVVVLRSAGGIAVVEPSDRFFGDDSLVLDARSGPEGGVKETGRRAAT